MVGIALTAVFVALRAARTVWAVGIRLSACPLVVMSAVMLVGLFVIRALGGAASTLVGEGPEGDDDRDLHRLQDFAERNQIPYRTVLRSHRSAWTDLAETCALPEAGTAVVTGERR